MDTKRNWLGILNPRRRSFLKTVGAGAAVASTSGLVELGAGTQEAQAFPYAPYPRDDDLTTVVTSCDHNCGSRHMLVTHKKGDVIVRLSTDDGRYQEGGKYLADVFVLESHRGRGLGKLLMGAVVARPDLQGLRR